MWQVREMELEEMLQMCRSCTSSTPGSAWNRAITISQSTCRDGKEKKKMDKYSYNMDESEPPGNLTAHSLSEHAGVDTNNYNH
jgi:hypothetical protein